MKHFKLSTTLYLLTALQLFFMLVVGVTGLVAIRRTSQGLTTVYNDRVVPLKQLKTIADAYAVSVIDAVNKANAGLMTAEETRKGLLAASEDIRKNWLAYKATTLTSEEADLARQAEQLFVPADKSVAALLQRLDGKSGTLKDSLGDFDGPLYASVDPISGAITGLVDLQLRVAEVEYRDAERRYGTTLRFVGFLLLFGALCSGGLGWWVSRSVSSTIRGVAHGLAVSAEQTAAAAGQVSTTSQLLAEATNEQAASLEETGSSLEELSSMTQRNASSTQQANELAKEARVAADQGAADMDVMDHAMGDIRTASAEIAKILKSIDEIAFQTNLLALNAAVEAARAGEAGMGFAVVADEVRGLAQRAATAARETATMVENAVRSSSQGMEVSGRVSLALAQIVAKARAVDELVAQVAAASVEQNHGIAQLNTAVSQIDQVTQGNAANAEESAAASEELNAQAEMMRHAVNDLLALVNGTGQSDSAAGAPENQAAGSGANGASGPTSRLVRQARPAPGASAKPPTPACAPANGSRKLTAEVGGTLRG